MKNAQINGPLVHIQPEIRQQFIASSMASEIDLLINGLNRAGCAQDVAAYTKNITVQISNHAKFSENCNSLS